MARPSRLAMVGLLGATLFACRSIVRFDTYHSNPVEGRAADGAVEGAAPDGSPACGADLATDHEHCGSCTNRCSQDQFCVRGGCTRGCSGGIVYVAPPPVGNDANDGCNPSAPRATLDRALDGLKTLGALRHEIHACRGLYPENQLTLDYPVSIRGSYDCATWTRAGTFPAALLAAGTSAGPNEATVIENGSYALRPWTLRVSSTAITVDTLVEGIVVHGSASGTNGSAAIVIETGAAPTVTHSIMIGGNTSAPDGTVGSLGLLVNGAAPLITENLISGGNGAAPTEPPFGSIGAYFVNRSQVILRGNEVHGGSGSTPSVYPSIAVPTAGIRIDDPAGVELVGNRVHGGSGSCNIQTIPCFAFAVDAHVKDPQARMVIAQNRIYGGDLGGAADVVSYVGLRLAGDTSDAPADARIWNNEIHAGLGPAPNKPTNLAYTALEVDGGGRADIRWNTLYSPTATPRERGVVLKFDGTRISNGTVGTGHRFAQVRHNVLAGGDTFGVELNGFSDATIGEFRNNVIVTRWYSALKSAGTDPTEYAYISIGDAVLASASEGNLQIAESCAMGDTGCTAATPWVESVLALRGGTPWKDDAASLLSPDGGWTLAANAACGIRLAATATPFPAVDGGTDVDLFGSLRTPPYSMGAYEYPKDTCP